MKHGITFNLEGKAVSESGEFEGYASVFNKEDLAADVVLPGAFAESLKTRAADRVKMLRQHDTSEPIGIWTSLTEDPVGLKATGKLILGTAKGRETYELLKAGALDGLSIGFKTRRDRFDAKRRVRFLEEIDLREISLVTFPMMESALISAVKSDNSNARLIRAITDLKKRVGQ